MHKKWNWLFFSFLSQQLSLLDSNLFSQDLQCVALKIAPTMILFQQVHRTRDLRNLVKFFFLIFWSHLGSGQIISYLVRRSLHRTKITLVITRPRNWELVANKQHKCNSIFCNKKWQRCSFADKTILTNCFSNCNNFGLINDPWTLRSKTVSRPLVFLKVQMADNKLVSKSIYDFRKRH